MKRYFYLLTLVFVFVLPAVVGGVYLRDEISVSQLAVFVALVTIIGSIWDVWATKHGKTDSVWLWSFNKKQTLGVTFLGLPIEEYAFYVASSTYVVVMWEVIKQLLTKKASAALLLLAGLTIWTLTAILVPYFLGGRRDKLIG